METSEGIIIEFKPLVYLGYLEKKTTDQYTLTELGPFVINIHIHNIILYIYIQCMLHNTMVMYCNLNV